MPATPSRRTMSVTRFGVSALNVVATIDSPASHQGTARPEAKNSDVLRPARWAKNNAGPKQIKSETATISQSSGERCMDAAESMRSRPDGRAKSGHERMCYDQGSFLNFSADTSRRAHQSAGRDLPPFPAWFPVRLVRNPRTGTRTRFSGKALMMTTLNGRTVTLLGTALAGLFM